jgi:hypothetical protein
MALLWLFSNKVMQNIRIFSIITYIKYLRISTAMQPLISYRITLSARAAKTVGSDWTCSKCTDAHTPKN